MRKRALLTLLPTAGLLSLLWFSGSRSTALADTSEEEERYTLTIYPRPTGGNVRTEPEGAINCGSGGDDCTEIFVFDDDDDRSVTLIAEPDHGFTFAEWGGDCFSCHTSTTCTIIMDANKTCYAIFIHSSSIFIPSSGGGGGPGCGGMGEFGFGSGSESGGGSGAGGGGGCSAGVSNILAWLSVPLFALLRRIRRK